MKVQKKFVRYISHEIRTPLSAVKMGLQFLLAEITNVTQDREILDSLETTELAVIAAINILNDLLTFDKIEEGKLKLDRQVISARDLLISSTTIFRAQVTTSVQLNVYMLPRVKTAFSTQSFNTNLLLACSLLSPSLFTVVDCVVYLFRPDRKTWHCHVICLNTNHQLS